MTTEKLATDNGASKRKSTVHDLASCEMLDRPTINGDRFIEKEGFIFELVSVIENTFDSCPKRHNSDTLVYQLVEGAIGYDN